MRARTGRSWAVVCIVAVAIVGGASGAMATVLLLTNASLSFVSPVLSATLLLASAAELAFAVGTWRLESWSLKWLPRLAGFLAAIVLVGLCLVSALTLLYVEGMRNFT
jgi:hypothetical protein